MKKRYLVPASIITIALISFFAACGSNQTSRTSTSSSPNNGPTVDISNFAFSPPTLTVSAGSTVTWINDDSVTHNVTSDTGIFISGSIEPDATFSYTFTSPGTYAYSCTIHPSMKGKIIVQ